MEPHGAAGSASRASGRPRASSRHGGHGGGLKHGEPPSEDETLQHPRCVFQILKRHFARYTPEFVAEHVRLLGRGLPRGLRDAICANSGRERTSAFCYAVGWTQHTVGVQTIRTAAIIQLLLGNIGRPGGGILALRGHASIQGSTDIPTLYDIAARATSPMPHAETYGDLDGYVEANTSPSGWWGNSDAYCVSLLKAYCGERATADNDFCFEYLPRIDDDNSHYWTRRSRCSRGR